MSRIGGHPCRHIPDFHLHLQVVTGRIQPRVRHIGPAFGRTRRPGQAHHLGAQKHAFYTCRHRVPVQQPGGGVAHPLDDIRQAEYRFFTCKTVRQVLKNRRQISDLLLCNILHLVQKRGDQRLAFYKAVRFATPAPVADLRVVVRRLAGPA